MKWTVLLFFVCIQALAIEPVKIAIIDTGLDLTDRRFQKVLCSSGHYNYVDNTTNTLDTHGHGTHIAGLIKKYAEHANYCLVILKFYSVNNTGAQNKENIEQAIKKAVQIGVKIINISGGGPGFENKEYTEIREAKDIKFIVAVGNEGVDVDKPGNQYYPACYGLPNIIAVGNLKADGTRSETSNYGFTVKVWERGENMYSTLPDGKMGYMSGTSMATAVHTGKLIKLLYDNH